MKTSTLSLLLFFLSSVSAKGGGGGRGSSSSGRYSNSGGGSSGGSGGGGATGSSGSGGALSAPRAGTVPSYGAYNFPAGSRGFNKGGYGGFTSPPPMQYINTRATYINYRPTYTGGYGVGGYRSGWVGAYNPALLYWALIPSAFYLGYYSAYHRYNSQTGAYYAPEITYSGSGTSNVQINGTEYTSQDDNYHYTFDISTEHPYPVVDHAYFATSDLDTPTADFIYRLTFGYLVDFVDANDNGFFDAGDTITAVTNLGSLQWDPITVNNITSAGNSTLTYLEASTVARNVAYNGTGPAFDVHLTWRHSNLQINMTDGIAIQPNSLQYNLTLVNYPQSPTAGNARTAAGQVLTTPSTAPVHLDITPDMTALTVVQIKTNETFGLSIGNYSEGRLEYDTAVNLTLIPSPPSTLSTDIDSSQADAIWSNPEFSQTKQLLLASMPRVGNNSQLLGFGFLDTDVMNAMSSYYDSAASSVKLSALTSVAAIILSTFAVAFIL